MDQEASPAAVRTPGEVDRVTRNAASMRSGEALLRDVRALGIRLEGEPADVPPNIEETIFSVSIEGLKGDYRLLDLLVSWLEVYGRWVHPVGLLSRLALFDDRSLRAFWTAIALWPNQDDSWDVLVTPDGGPRLDLPAGDNRIALARHGEDPLFVDGPLRVPGNFFGHRREDDVLPIWWMVHRHATLRWRTVLGPCHRADLWATLERNPALDVWALAAEARAPLTLAAAVKVDFEALRGWALLPVSRR